MYRTIIVFVCGLLLGLGVGGGLPVARAEPVADLDALFSRDARGRLVLRVPKGLIIEGALSAHGLEVTRAPAVFHQGVEVKRVLKVGEELQVGRGLRAATIEVADRLIVGKGLRVGGEASFGRDVRIERGLKVRALEVTDQTKLRGDVVHERGTRLDGDVVIRRTLTAEDLVVKDDATIGDDTLMRGDLKVEGTLERRR